MKSKQKLVYMSSGFSVQFDFNMIQFYFGFLGVVCLQYHVENLMITKTLSVNTPKTRTSYRQDTQRVHREGYYCLFLFFNSWKIETNSCLNKVTQEN